MTSLTDNMITIDGSRGEGGGQILRTSLALSLVTGRPVHFTRIRAGRSKPGLLRQHLTAVDAARQVGDAVVEGASLGSKELTFTPRGIYPGRYQFAVGTAGSATLVLQTVLPALMTAGEPSHLTLEGGTHNPMAPPFDFLQKTFAPVLARFGPKLDLSLESYGFFPVGGGRFQARIEPVAQLTPVNLLERGPIRERRARVILSKLPFDVADRELRVVRNRLDWSEKECFPETIHNSPGPGNAVLLEIASKHVTEVFSAYGERGVKAEIVAKNAVVEAKEYLRSNAVAGEHLADQLLLPLALAGGGAFVTGPLSSHTTTNIETIRLFLNVDFEVTEIEPHLFRIEAMAV